MKRNLKNHLDLPKDFSLESLRNQNPFRVPDGYFDELPYSINDRIENKPSLESLRDQNPFRVPEGYFNELPHLIAHRIEANPSVAKSRRFLHPGVFAAAASVVIMLGLTVLMRSSIFESTSETQFSSIPETHIVNHLDNDITTGDIDESTLVDAVVNNALQETNTTTASTKLTQSVAKVILPSVSDDDLIDYIVQNETPTNPTAEILK